jgi:hypothetical protein
MLKAGARPEASVLPKRVTKRQQSFPYITITHQPGTTDTETRKKIIVLFTKNIFWEELTAKKQNDVIVSLKFI